jgi:hypothetical protein
LLIIGLFFNFFSAVTFTIPLLKNRKEEENAVRQTLFRDRKFAFAGLSLLSAGFLFDVLSLFIPVNVELKTDIATFGISLIGFALAVLYFLIISTAFERSKKHEADDKAEADAIKKFIEKRTEGLKIVLSDYEAFSKEVERRENITVVIGSILITASMLIFGNSAISETENPIYPYALTSILLFVFWLFFLHATTRELDNIAYTRLKTIEKALSDEEGNYNFGIHSYLTSVTQNTRRKTVWWLMLRKQFWGLVLILLCLAWLMLSLVA